MLASARTVSAAGKSPTFKHALAASANVLEVPPTPRITQQPTLGRAFSYDGDRTLPGPGSGLSMRDILPHRAMYENAITTLRAGVGLGIDFNSRDVGPLAPPATPSLACSETLPDSGLRRSNPETVEGQALNAITSSKLFMRRRQANLPLAPISTTSSNSKSLSTKTPIIVQTTTSLPLPASAPLSPAMSAIHAYSSSSPTAAGTFVSRTKTDAEPIGLGISSPALREDAEEQEIIFEDDEWEYVKPTGMKSCKGRACTPFAPKRRWLL